MRRALGLITSLIWLMLPFPAAWRLLPGLDWGAVAAALAVLYILATVALLAWPASQYLWHEYRGLPIAPRRQVSMGLSLLAAVALSLGTFWVSMRRGVRALEELG